MFRSTCRLLLVALGASLGLALWFDGAASRAEEKANQDKTKPAEKAAENQKPGGKKIAMQAFMRKKLEASQSILEGLALEDFDLIAKGAKQLKTTSAAAEFLVIHDPL